MYFHIHVHQTTMLTHASAGVRHENWRRDKNGKNSRQGDFFLVALSHCGVGHQFSRHSGVVWGCLFFNVIVKHFCGHVFYAQKMLSARVCQILKFYKTVLNTLRRW